TFRWNGLAYSDGTLYASRSTTIYKIDPLSGALLDTIALALPSGTTLVTLGGDSRSDLPVDLAAASAVTDANFGIVEISATPGQPVVMRATGLNGDIQFRIPGTSSGSTVMLWNDLTSYRDNPIVATTGESG